jgi:hypothetical protein
MVSSLHLSSLESRQLTVHSVLCSEMAVKLIDEPFITATDDKEEWAL